MSSCSNFRSHCEQPSGAYSTADEHKCVAQAMREIKLPKYEKWANYDTYLPTNIERYCDFYSLGI